ncbi:MAG: cell division topological specificity factor MinE [Cyanobacteria bacterium SIG30]|nr:cell division topological specificity factor MinE [Cyanobacteria bacterium SIG30]
MKENIFADLYNKVISFFVTTEEPTEQTKLAAKSRLKSVLMQDRAGFSESSIQMLKDDMLKCIAKYMEIEEESFDLQISPDDDKTVLELSIPVLRAKTDEEITEALKQEEAQAQEKAKEIVEQLKDIVEEKVQELTLENDENEVSEDEESEKEEVIEEETSEEAEEIQAEENSSDDENNSEAVKADDEEQSLKTDESDEENETSETEEKPKKKKK